MRDGAVLFSRHQQILLIDRFSSAKPIKIARHQKAQLLTAGAASSGSLRFGMLVLP